MIIYKDTHKGVTQYIAEDHKLMLTAVADTRKQAFKSLLLLLRIDRRTLDTMTVNQGVM